MIAFGHEPDRLAAGTPRPPVAPIKSVLSRIFVEDAFLRVYYAALLMFTLLHIR